MLKIFRTEMSKAGVNYEETDSGNWEDGTRLGGWTRTHVRTHTYIYEFIIIQFNLSCVCIVV